MIDELKKVEADFTGFVKTLELKFFKGKLHQKIIAGHPGATPDHAWVPIESHDVDAPAPGEAIAQPDESDQIGSGEAKAPPKKTTSSADSKT